RGRQHLAVGQRDHTIVVRTILKPGSGEGSSRRGSAAREGEERAETEREEEGFSIGHLLEISLLRLRRARRRLPCRRRKRPRTPYTPCDAPRASCTPRGTRRRL